MKKKIHAAKQLSQVQHDDEENLTKNRNLFGEQHKEHKEKVKIK